MMRYSTLIPAYNAADTIREAILSVVAQSVPPQEIIVVDDGSTDGTGEIASQSDACVRVITQVNQGVGSATTNALRNAAFETVAMLDADDIWLPEKMACQIAYLKANPDCHGVFTYLRTFRSDGLEQGAGRETAGWLRSTLVMRKDQADRVGPVIDMLGDRGDMIDWIGRARSAGLRMDMLSDVLVLRRIRPGSLSYARDAEKDKGYVRVAWLALQRRNRLKP
jgi:glycosyltransferase involved in cell wall biosynthesis